MYADLIVQDKREKDLKKIRSENGDPDGLHEAETRQAFVGMYTVYFFTVFSATIAVSDQPVSSEPPRGKTNNVVSEQVRHKLACTVTEDGKRLEILDLESRGIVLSMLRKQRR